MKDKKKTHTRRTLMLWTGFEPVLSNVNDTFRDNFKLSPIQTPDCVTAAASLRSINDSERTYMNNINHRASYAPALTTRPP